LLTARHTSTMAMKAMKAMKVLKVKKCQNFRRCGWNAKSSRAKFCLSCFKENAAVKARSGSGNSHGNPGNAGNSQGNPQGNPGNAGNSQGNPDNGGNTITGREKRSAGRRSGIKRCAKIALVVKKHWLDKILTGEKDWEIRGCATARRGWIHLAESRAGGILVGRARLVDCIRVPKATFKRHVRRHCVTNAADVPYKSIFAWAFEDAERFAEPFDYEHSPGAVIWVKV